MIENDTFFLKVLKWIQNLSKRGSRCGLTGTRPYRKVQEPDRLKSGRTQLENPKKSHQWLQPGVLDCEWDTNSHLKNPPQHKVRASTKVWGSAGCDSPTSASHGCLRTMASPPCLPFKSHTQSCHQPFPTQDDKGEGILDTITAISSRRVVIRTAK